MNSFEKIDPALIDAPLEHESGYSREMQERDKPDEMRAACGSAARDFPKALWIEPGNNFSNWKDKARENDKNKTWGINRLDRFTCQSPTHECTGHSYRANFECARNRQRGIIFPDGPKKDYRYPESAEFGSVWISVMSQYAIANPGQWGGAMVRQLLEIGCRRGALPDKIQPRDYGFKHTLQGTAGKGNSNQSSGPWVTERQFPEGNEDTAKWFRAEEVIFVDSWEQEMCLLLHGLINSVGRDGHAVPHAGINFASEAIPYPDSYDVVRYDSFATARRAWQGSFCIVTVTTPNDWMKPAG